jgi:purine-binding chemotaxis protein CheW
MNEKNQLVIFNLDEQRFALNISAVERVVRAVEITPLPKAPEIVIGIINMHGQVIPVFNIRKRFRLPDREIRLNDQLIIAHTSKRNVVLLVDTVGEIFEHMQEEIVYPSTILPVTEYVEGVAKLEDGIVLIHNLDTFLSLDEERILEDALKEQKAEENGISGVETMRE